MSNEQIKEEDNTNKRYCDSCGREIPFKEGVYNDNSVTSDKKFLVCRLCISEYLSMYFDD